MWADMYRWEYQWTSTHMHVVRSDGEPLKIDQKAVKPDKRMHLKQQNLNSISMGKKKDSTSFCFPSKIWLWHVDHSENKRHPAKERNTVLDKHINKESVPGLPENSSVQPMPASDELFLPFIAKWKKVRTSFTSCIYLNDSIIFLDYVFPFFCHCCKYSFLLDKIMRVNDSWIDFLL